MTFPPIPAEFIDENHRLKWEYIYDRQGNTRQEILDMGFNITVANPTALVGFLKVRFPHHVSPDLDLTDISEGGYAFVEINQWLKANLRGTWQLWVIEKVPSFMFENDVDALHFKLRWC